MGSTSSSGETRYKGVRQRQWGKWVSEIRVPGTGDRLWLGSYANPEAAAMAHDAAVFFLRGPTWSRGFNFPDRVLGIAWASLSPTSVQRAASEWGMVVDAEMRGRNQQRESASESAGGFEEEIWGDILVDDMEIYM